VELERGRADLAKESEDRKIKDCVVKKGPVSGPLYGGKKGAKSLELALLVT